MRAVRTNDVEGYINILPAIIDIFFGLNRPNYARWGVLFHNKLMNAPPQCKAVLQSGAFSIRRTKKNFARSAIDLTLKQTVIRDASSSMKGITSTQFSMSVTELRSVVGLEGKEEPSSQLQASRVKKVSHHRDILIDAITESSDPFISPATTSPCLLNISTDKAASYITQEYLTTCLTSGRELREKFQEECAADEQRFLKPIRRRKVYNFAQESLNKKVSTTKRKSAAFFGHHFRERKLQPPVSNDVPDNRVSTVSCPFRWLRP